MPYCIWLIPLIFNLFVNRLMSYTNMRYPSMLVSCLLMIFILGCSPESETRYSQLVMTTNLVDDPAIIRMYDSLHSKQGVWPALEKANKAAGIKSVRIWRAGTRLMMIIEVPENADMVRLDSLYVSADPKVKEWGAMMSNFQRSLPGVDSTQKWTSMDIIHHYEDGVYLK